MSKFKLVLTDLLDQSDILAEAIGLYGGNVTAVLSNDPLNSFIAVRKVFNKYGHALVELDEWNIVEVTSLEVENGN
jgi:hypothetical protein